MEVKNMESSRVKKAIIIRNLSWKKINIPNWVNIKDVSLDQYYTNNDVALKYYNKAI